MCGIELELISVSASEYNCFLCRGRKLLGFGVCIKIKWVFVSGHSNRLGFRMRAANRFVDLIVVRVAEIELVSLWGIDLL